MNVTLYKPEESFMITATHLTAGVGMPGQVMHDGHPVLALPTVPLVLKISKTTRNDSAN